MKTSIIHQTKSGFRALLTCGALTLASCLALTRVSRADDGYVDYQKVVDYYASMTGHTEPEPLPSPTPGNRRQMAYLKATKSKAATSRRCSK